jgi:hypothetical protein
MAMQRLPVLDVAYLDPLLLDAHGQLAVLPAACYAAIEHDHLRTWAHKHGVYQFPTAELIDWLRAKIAGVKAIEIGAGVGAIGRALGIPSTDSYQQTEPKTVLAYALMGQPCIVYPPDVARMDARTAIRHHKPHTVIGAWITQKHRKGDRFGNESGVDDEWLLRNVKRYIMIGNAKTHGDNRMLVRPHQELAFPWLVSRSMAPELNRIYVVEGE